MMRTYLYYPGCSLQGTAAEYDRSARGVMAALGARLLELEDWTCCGASAAEATGFWAAMALPARNLALAEAMAGDADTLLVPCSACYLNLLAVARNVRQDAGFRETVNHILEADGLQLTGGIRVRHLLDVLAGDFGPAAVSSRVQKPMASLKIAPYYGCQCLRPWPLFDDPERPRSMEGLITACGASVFPWTMGGACCGASLTTTKPAVGKAAVARLLRSARGADAILTVCPMCQLNLEAFQGELSRKAGDDLAVTVLYLPQLLGLALGLSPAALALGRNLALTAAFRAGSAA